MDRPGQIEEGFVARVEHRCIDAARPAFQIAEAPRAQIALQRAGGDHDAAGRGMKAAQD